MKTNRFQTYGLRSTKARRAIVEVMEQADHALSQQELSMKLEVHQFDKATLYRNLHTLTEHGLVHRVATPSGVWAFALSEAPTESEHSVQHAHFICEQCDRVYCLPELQRDASDLNTDHRFQIKGAELRLFGDCEDCMPSDN